MIWQRIVSSKTYLHPILNFFCTQNFHGHTFRIVTLEYAPFSCYDKMEMKEENGRRGAGKRGAKLKLRDCVDTRMLRAMATSLNFTYSVREPVDGQWGYRLQNGSYTGECRQAPLIYFHNLLFSF